MKSTLSIALSLITLAAFGQESQLYSTELIKAKAGKGAAFEAAWTAHVAKFHANDNKGRFVYSILSGPQMGFYQLIEGPATLAGMDKDNPAKALHDQDYDQNVLTNIDRREGNLIYFLLDSLSVGRELPAEKVQVTVYHIKNGRQAAFMEELKRELAAYRKIKSPAAYNLYQLLWSGSAPQVMRILNLQEGFKQLEPGNLSSPAFQEAYIRENSRADWNRRLVLLREVVDREETYISKLNKPLSTIPGKN